MASSPHIAHKNNEIPTGMLFCVSSLQKVGRFGVKKIAKMAPRDLKLFGFISSMH